MLNCPNCHTLNDPGSRFCIKCGQSLTGAVETAVSNFNPYRQQLAIATGRLLITLLLVWVLRSVLRNLSFIKGLLIPDIPFSADQIIVIIAYLIILVLLVGFIQTLRQIWPIAYPRLASLTPALTVIIYVVVLSLVYKAALPVLFELAIEPTDFLLALRVTLSFIALLMIGWAGKVIYDGLPAWLASIRFDTPVTIPAQVACEQCGRRNPAAMNYCGYCRHALKPELDTDVANE